MSHSTLKSVVFVLQGAMPILLLAVVVTLGVLLVRFRLPNRKGRILRFLAALILLCGCGISLSWAIPQEYAARMELARAERHKSSSLVNVGDRVPSFSIVDTEGLEFSTEALRGSVLVINFSATWCGPCNVELPHLGAIDSDYQSLDNFKLIVIGRGETQEVLREFRTKHQITMSMAADPDEAIYRMFADGGSIPRTIVVSPTGTIVYAKAEYYERDIPLIRNLIKQNL